MGLVADAVDIRNVWIVGLALSFAYPVQGTHVVHYALYGCMLFNSPSDSAVVIDPVIWKAVEQDCFALCIG